MTYDWRQHVTASLPTGEKRTERQKLAQSMHHTLTRAQVRLVACPKCGAKPGHHCWKARPRTERTTTPPFRRISHIERHVAAEALFHTMLHSPR